jgi:two-component system cell cycle sensor histidine kinase/response regulator CckA
LRDVTRRVLSGGGYAVHEARDGEEALAYVRDGARVDVVVADIELPGMSGVECAREIAQGRQETRILYTSGMTADPRGDQADAKYSTFLPKPYSPDDLMRSVRKALDAKS